MLDAGSYPVFTACCHVVSGQMGSQQLLGVLGDIINGLGKENRKALG
jgi:hypothetical protein